MAFRSTWSPSFNCIVRDGDQGIPCADISLSIWFKWDNTSASYEAIEINGSAGGSFAACIEISGGDIVFHITNANGSSRISVTGPAYSAGVWTHAALTYNSTTLTGYVNGASVGTATGLTGTRGNWFGLQVGPGVGELQDACFYTVALTPEEVVQLYRNRLPGRRDGLRHHLPCFPGAANRLIDYSGNALDFTDAGTPADATTWPQASWNDDDTLGYYSADGGTTDFSGVVGSPTAVTGSTAIKNQFSGAIASTTACTGTLQVRKFFTSGTAASPTACVATLAVRKLASGVVGSPTACTGTGQSRIRFTSNTCLSPTACAGSLTILGLVAFSGVATSPTACTASANVRKTTAGTCTSPTACTASLNVRKSSSASANSPSACTGSLNVRKFFSGTATSPTACQGLQSGGTVLTPANPEDPRNSQKRRLFAVGHFHRRGRQ